MTEELNLFAILLDTSYQPMVDLGLEIGKLYTDKGLPVDMALDRLEGYTKAQKLAILSGCCDWFIEHKRLSGATEPALDRQRKTNRDIMECFISSGEVGIY